MEVNFQLHICIYICTLKIIFNDCYKKNCTKCIIHVNYTLFQNTTIYQPADVFSFGGARMPFADYY